MRKGNFYTQIQNIEKTVRGYRLVQTVLFACILFISAPAVAQTYYQISNTSGTAAVGGVNVTVVASGGAIDGGQTYGSSCNIGPYYSNGTGGTFTFTFGTPVPYIKIPLVFLCCTAGTAQFSVNGSTYTLTGGNITGSANCNGDANVSVVSGGNLTNSGDVGNASSAIVVITGTINSFAVTDLGGPTFSFSAYLGNTTPTFLNGSTQSMSVCENAGAADITSLMHVSDADASQTETWTLSTGTNHGGTVTGFSTANTASSGSTNITPGNAVTYTPAAGYSGTETFAIQVSDGIATSTTSFTVTVNPLPVATVTPTSQNVCNNANTTAINFTSSVGSTTYTWVNSNTAIGMGASGSGSNIASFTASNSGASPISGVFTVTPTANSCAGATQTFTVVVNPTPIMTVTPTSQTVNNNANTTAINFTSSVGSTTFVWANSNTSIGIGASGSGSSIASFTATNSGASPISGIFTVTPTANSCPGPIQTFTITVAPSAVVTSVSVPANGSYLTGQNLDFTVNFNEAVTVAGTPQLSITLDVGGTVHADYLSGSGTSSITFRYTIVSGNHDYNGIALGASIALNGGTILDAGSNNAVLTLNGVPSTTGILVNPNTAPTFNNGTTQSFGICENAGAYNITSLLHVSDADASQTETWTVSSAPNNGGTLTGFSTANAASSGSTNITPGNTVTYQPAAGFSGTETFAIQVSDGTATATTNFTVTVNPTPTVNSISDQTVCNNTSTTAVTFGGTVSGTTYSWTNTNTGIGLAASGTGNISAFTATNGGTSAISGLITVTPTANSCNGPTASFAISVNPTPSVNSISDQTVCNSTATTAVTFGGAVAGTTFGWTNNNTSIGLAASGTGNIASFTATNSGTAATTATITVTPSTTSCTGSSTSFVITVNPTPTVNSISNQTVCNNTSTTAVTFGSPVAGTTYSWTNTNTGIGLAASGTGNISSFTATNGGTSGISGLITVTPSANSCTGSTASFTITVNPTPTVSGASDQSVCNALNTTAVTFGGTVAGTTYSWTNTTTSIGLAASGTGNIASFTATNTGAAVVTATITVTPSANSCNGSSTNFTIDVNPTPTITLGNNPYAIKGFTSTNLAYTGTSGGASTYTIVWNAAAHSATFADVSSTSIPGSPISVTIPGTAVAAVYNGTITVTSSASCIGAAVPFTVTVIDTPTTWYSNPGTTGDGADVLASWWSNNDGTGANAIDFTTAIDTFVMQNDMTTSGDWSIAGSLILNAGTFGPNGNISVGTAGVSGDVTMNGTSIFSSQANPDITVTLYRNLSVNGSASWDNPPAYTQIIFANTSSSVLSPQTISWTTTSSSDYTGITINSNVVVKLLGNTLLPPNDDQPEVINGTLICNNFVLDVNGNDFHLYRGATLYTQNTSGVNGTIIDGGTITFDAGGNYVFNGTSVIGAQVTGTSMPSLITSYGSITVNNPAGITLSQTTMMDSFSSFNLMAGRVTLGSNDLELADGLILTGGTFSSGAMFVTNGTGQLKLDFTTDGSFMYPVGDTSGNYTPITINMTAGSYGAGAYAGVNVVNAKDPNNVNVSNYLNRYWYVTTPGITSPVYSVSAMYVPGDVTGTEANLSAGQYSGSLPWMKYGVTNTTTHTLSIPGSTVATGDVTGLTTAGPTTNSSADTSICPGSYAPIAANTAVGDPGFSYSWAPAATLSAATGLSVIATPTMTTTYTVTITDGNGFTGTHTTTVTLYPIPDVLPTADFAVCNNAATTTVVYTGSVTPTTYTWTNDNSSIGLASSGTGNIASFTAANITSVTDAGNIIVTPSANGCVGIPDTFMITVYPTPNVVPTADQAECNGAGTDAVSFSGAVSGTTYTWTNNNSTIGLATTGGGDIASFTATNSTSVTDTGTIIVTPSANGCAGPVDTFMITVYPTPNVMATPDQAKCNGLPTDSVTFSGAVSGTTYAWTNDNPTIGLASTGAGDISSFTAINTATVADTANIIVTSSANGCVGTSDTFMVIVNPTPANITGTDSVCSGSSTLLNDIDTAGTWSASNPHVLVNSTGLVLGVTAGTSIITYTLPTSCITTVVFTVDTLYVPSISISSGGYDTSCVGTYVLFTANVASAGASPVFVWERNGWPVAISPTYALVPNNGDNIYCKLATAQQCQTTDTTASNHIILQVDSSYIPFVAITATPGTSIHAGETATLMAAVTHGGPEVTYQWVRNSTPITGATTNTYTSNSFADNDSISCGVQSVGLCGYFSFNSVRMHVSPSGTTIPTLAGGVTIFPNPTTGMINIKAEVAGVFYLYTLEGRSLGEYEIAEGITSITLPNELAAGIYMGRYAGTDGNTVLFKIVKN